MTEWFEIAFAELYPVLYPHRDDTEARTMVEAYADVLGGAGPVVDLACGDGRYANVLVGHGVSVFGIDLSEFLLSRAVDDRGLAGRLVRADMRRLPLCPGSAGAVINMFTSFGYFGDDAENRGVLEEVYAALRPGGVFILDFINAEWLLSHDLLDTIRHRDGYTIKEQRRLEGGSRYVVKNVDVTRDDSDESVDYEERVRLFKPSELEDMLEAVGLRIRERAGAYDRSPYERSASERIILLADKPEDTQ